MIRGGRSSSDLDSVEFGKINRSDMDQLIDDYIIKYRTLGFKVSNLKKISQRTLLILATKDLISTELVCSKNGSTNETQTLVYVSFMFKLNVSVLDYFISRSEMPYSAITVEGVDFLCSDSFFRIRKIRIKSPKNLNVVEHGLEGAIRLSQTSMRINKDYRTFVLDEIKILFKTEGYMNNIPKHLSFKEEDLSDSKMLWWDKLLEENLIFKKLISEDIEISQQKKSIHLIKKDFYDVKKSIKIGLKKNKKRLEIPIAFDD
jgi:hypothetical protein